MALQHPKTISIEEYFQLEEDDPEHRYEYVDGYVYMMSGGTVNHDTIKSNIERILWGLLRGRECRTYSSDMKVFVSETRYYHPDVTVSCDPHNRGTQKRVHAPRLVVEVLSPSTETTDRRRKLRDYLACSTIEEYLLVDARSVTIEIYRKEGKKWVYEMLKDDDVVELTSLGVHFPLLAAYEDVDFEEGFSELEDKPEDVATTSKAEVALIPMMTLVGQPTAKIVSGHHTFEVDGKIKNGDTKQHDIYVQVMLLDASGAIVGSSAFFNVDNVHGKGTASFAIQGTTLQPTWTSIQVKVVGVSENIGTTGGD